LVNVAIRGQGYKGYALALITVLHLGGWFGINRMPNQLKG